MTTELPATSSEPAVVGRHVRVWGWTAAVLLLAFALRTGAAVYWQSRQPVDQPYAFGDSHGYLHLAQQIRESRPYEYGGPDFRVFRTPGYPLLLAGWLSVAGSEPAPLWARMLSVVGGTMAVGISMLLAKHFFDWPTALFAGGLLAFYPGAVVTSVFVLSEGPFIPLMVGQLYCWARAAGSAEQPAEDNRRLWTGWALAAGVLGGCATLVRPSWLLFVPFTVPWALLHRERKHQFKCIGVTLAGMIVVMAPWWIRNWKVTGRFVATSLQMGASLYDGWNPEADGSSDMRYVARFYREVKNEQLAGRISPREFEYTLDQRMKGAATDWAAANPGRVAELAGIKLFRMWTPWPNASELGSLSTRLLLALGYVPLAGLALYATGLIVIRSEGWQSWPFTLCLLPAIYFTLLHMIFVSSLRYREPAMFPLIVLGAGAAIRRWPGLTRYLPGRLPETRSPAEVFPTTH